MIGLLIISIATYLAFRKYSRNAVFAQSENRSNRIHVRNLQFEKKIMVTILLIMLVVLVSLTPYLIVQKMSDNCHHDEHQDEHEEENTNCNESKEFAIAKVFSVSLLCLSCALNPTLYAWRIPLYRQSLKMVVNAAWRQSPSISSLALEFPVPTILQIVNQENETNGND
jgi:NADH:ubiquinone oxidoreductase subunit 5 (subunit L)/multisubunit Na+/H+ antiporter MnhA subunit